MGVGLTEHIRMCACDYNPIKQVHLENQFTQLTSSKDQLTTCLCKHFPILSESPVQKKALRAFQFKSRYYPNNEMNKEFQILKVTDIVEYKLSRLIHSLLTGTPTLPETLNKLIVKMDSIHTLTTRNKHQVYSKKENRESENDN